MKLGHRRGHELKMAKGNSLRRAEPHLFLKKTPAPHPKAPWKSSCWYASDRPTQRSRGCWRKVWRLAQEGFTETIRKKKDCGKCVAKVRENRSIVTIKGYKIRRRDGGTLDIYQKSTMTAR